MLLDVVWVIGQLSSSAIIELWFQRYLVQLLSSIAFVHGKAVIHRDIKPANVLVNPEHQILKLADFGLATTVDGAREPCVGTLCYFAPEMAFGSQEYTCAIGKCSNLRVRVWRTEQTATVYSLLLCTLNATVCTFQTFGRSGASCSRWPIGVASSPSTADGRWSDQ